MSKKDVSLVVSGAGWIGSLAHSVICALRQLGATDKQIHSLVVDGGELPIGKIAGVLMEEIRKQEILAVGKPFMTIKRGQYLTVDALCHAVVAPWKKISDYANQILQKSALSPETEVDLWEVTVEELGFTNFTTLTEIFERAIALGFWLCLPEDIALARIQCGDNKWRIGAMELIADSDGDLHVLDLSSDRDGCWLGTFCVNPGRLLRSDCVLVFVRPRRK